MWDRFDPIKQNVDPFGGGHVYGERGWAYTDTGLAVHAWRPYPDYTTEKLRYWCHGHATLSYYLHGFSIYGKHIEKVLNDEWVRIEKKPQIGDVIAFRDIGGTHQGEISHTARVESATHAFNKRTAFTLSSKNGRKKLLRSTTIDDVMNVYDETAWFEETPSGCCGGMQRVKEYYRRKSNLHRDPIASVLGRTGHATEIFGGGIELETSSSQSSAHSGDYLL